MSQRYEAKLFDRNPMLQQIPLKWSRIFISNYSFFFPFLIQETYLKHKSRVIFMILNFEAWQEKNY